MHNGDIWENNNANILSRILCWSAEAACSKNREMIMHGQKWLGTLSDEMNDKAHIWPDYKRYEWIGVIHYY